MKRSPANECNHWWRRAVAAICAAGVALTLATVAAGPATAAQSDAATNEPDYNGTIGGVRATQVYSLRIPKSANALVTVHGALGTNDGNGGLVDTWERVSKYTYEYGSIISPNQLWEFVPEGANTGGSLSTGYGFLRNRQSGKCLQVMSASTEPVALVNQWDCGAGFTNELWTLSQGRLRVKHSGAVLGLDTPTCQGSIPGGNGNVLYAKAVDAFCMVVPQQENYRFETNRIDFIPPEVVVYDNAMYACLLGYSKWTPDYVSRNRLGSLFDSEMSLVGYFYENLSSFNTKPVRATHRRVEAIQWPPTWSAAIGCQPCPAVPRMPAVSVPAGAPPVRVAR